MYRNCYMEHPINKRSFTIMDNENLLNSIYQNIAMVLETIPEIRKITTDCDFKALIISQEEEYQNLSDSIKDTITSNGDSTEELNDLLKTYSEWMTKLKAMSDKNVSHLSEMCIQGYTMGMIKAIQKNARENNDPERPVWPMIVLRTPKGWTGPKVVDGQQIEGSFRAHQVPLTMESPEHLELLKEWLGKAIIRKNSSMKTDT